MAPTPVKDRLKAYCRIVEDRLAACLKDNGTPDKLLAAMEYSLLAGGKRLRPALCLAVGGMFGLKREEMVGFACGLELIHTYSLIHDDLPAMDNDDLRRGKPTNHVVFGEAAAILAGDGLLTEAFGMFLDGAPGVPVSRVAEATRLAVQAAGAGGMVGGQVLDMEYTGRGGVSLAELQAMHALKTGALIQVACLTGAVLAGVSEADRERVAEYGAAVGLAFQIVDDILDEVGDTATLGKPAGSDREQGKTTYPALVGLAESRRLAEVSRDRALAALEPYTGEDADFLRDLARYIVDRVS